MPLPISGGRSAGDALERFKDRLLKEWQSAIPRGVADQPMGHEGGARALLNFAQSGQLGGGDGTGRVMAGPAGLSIQRYETDLQGGAPRLKEAWGLDVNPVASSASLRRGDISVGGTWDASNPSGFVRKGGLELRGGMGFAPGAEGPGAPFAGPAAQGYGPVRQSMPPQPGAWGFVQFEAGAKPKSMSEGAIERRSMMESDRALAPFGQPKEEAIPRTAREELEQQLNEYRGENPYWYRP